MPSAAKPGRRPLQSGTTNTVLDPPNLSTIKQSPFKSTSQKRTSPLTPLKPSHPSKMNMVAFKPPTDSMKATDSMQKKQPLMSRFKTVAQKPPMMEQGMGIMGKENSHPLIYPAPTFSLSIDNYYQKPNGKRLLEPAPIRDGRPQKKPRLDEGPLPPHDSFPPIVDDGTKPGHSYAQLIGMAILRSPQRRLTLSQIYKWISDNYSFYSPQDAGWQNSIRHNLSLNKHFIKQERPKDDPGKGNYWAIEAGMEHTFMKEKPTRKTANTVENLPVMSTMMEPSLPQLPHMPLIHEPALPMQLPSMPDMLPTHGLHNMHEVQPQPEISSDATIPISDQAAPEESQEKVFESDFQAENGLCSPLPTTMHSSPPVPKRQSRANTPPPPTRLRGSSLSRSHKRKFASMDDSGYISSLESSALRSTQNGRLNSEAERPRIKRGRAEEEIARLRASSYDSPSKGRSFNYVPNSSSPLRAGNHKSNSLMLPPVTPAVKLKAPPKPPPSVSPNTNLRIHRNRIDSMLESPLRRIPNVNYAGGQWGSPAINMDEPISLLHVDTSVYHFADEAGLPLEPIDLNATFKIFEDEALDIYRSLGEPSPIKRSTKRARLDRTQSSNILGDATNSVSRRSVTSAPFLKLPNQSPALALDTPSRFFDNLPSSPSKLFMTQSPSKGSALPQALGDENSWLAMDDFCTADFLQESDDFGGLDILQGFERIGSTTQPAGRSSAKAHGKPGLGRSYTSTF